MNKDELRLRNRVTFRARLLKLAVPGLRVLVGAILASAGIAKLFQPDGFRVALAVIPLVSESSIVRPVAVGFPMLEVALGLLLISGHARRVASVAAVCFFFLFVSTSVFLSVNYGGIECGCFGPVLRETVTESVVLRNLLLLASSLFLLYCESSAGNMEQFVQKSPG